MPSDVSIVNFEHISHLVLELLLLTWNIELLAGQVTLIKFIKEILLNRRIY